jgi:hypothetical protein
MPGWLARVLPSPGQDKSDLRVMELPGGELGERFGNQSNWLLSPDGQTVVTHPGDAEQEGNVELWDVPPRKPLKRLIALSVGPPLLVLGVGWLRARRKKGSLPPAPV